MARPPRAQALPLPLERAVRSETVKHYAETIFYIRQEEDGSGRGVSPSGSG